MNEVTQVASGATMLGFMAGLEPLFVIGAATITIILGCVSLYDRFKQQ